LLCFGSKKSKDSKGSKLSNRFSNERFVFLKKQNMMKFRKNLLNLHHFLNFQETNRSLEKRLKSFDPLDSFDFFDLKHNYALFTLYRTSTE